MCTMYYLPSYLPTPPTITLVVAGMHTTTGAEVARIACLLTRHSPSVQWGWVWQLWL